MIDFSKAKSLFLMTKEDLDELALRIAKESQRLAQTEVRQSEPFAEFPEYLTRSQAAEVLNCSMSTVDKLRRDKALKPVYFQGGSRPKYEKREVLSLYEKRENDW